MSVRPSKDRGSRQVKMSFGGKPSGLRNPSRAMRGLGAIALMLEALVLLLVLLPLRMLQDGISSAQLVFVFFGIVAAILLTGMLGRPLGWWLGLALQGVLVIGGLASWLIGIVGVVFGLVWLYVLYVRKRILL